VRSPKKGALSAEFARGRTRRIRVRRHALRTPPASRVLRDAAAADRAAEHRGTRSADASQACAAADRTGRHTAAADRATRSCQQPHRSPPAVLRRWRRSSPPVPASCCQPACTPPAGISPRRGVSDTAIGEPGEEPKTHERRRR
jgi:hypothetical protein